MEENVTFGNVRLIYLTPIFINIQNKFFNGSLECTQEDCGAFYSNGT